MTSTSSRLVLQRLSLPDPAISTERTLFVHLEHLAHLRMAEGEIVFGTGGTAWFTTYMNLLNLRLWENHCQIDGLWLRLKGQGRFGLRVWQVTSASLKETTLVEEVIDLSETGAEIDLTAAFSAAQTGVVMFRLTAFGEGCFTGGEWLTEAAVDRDDPLRLAVSITTFRREDEVTATATRIGAFLDGEARDILKALGADVHLFVVDNGKSAQLAPHPRLTVIPNANLGGAGGFARGLAAATDGGFTHCLFMDDDASFQMESLVRTLTFLRLAKSPRAAVSGAMISDSRTWAMWENGAVFNGVCQPQHIGVDLRNYVELAQMEIATAEPKPPGFYAGWWYFAFPIAEVERYPFPFFVRGDDISFSLANQFDTATLNGVVSFQEDFSAKESPLTLYLDLRNHLHHHLVQPGLERSAFGTARIALRFIARSLIRMHYDSAEAQLMAWEDVMKGPTFFAENADMMAKRPEVTSLIRTEAWSDSPSGQQTDLPDITQGPGRLKTALMKWTLNGHLIPFWSRIGRSVTIPMPQRGLIWTIWGAKDVEFVDPARSKTYRVTHSKTRFWQIAKRSISLLLRWNRAYSDLQQSYRDAYPELASRDFWETQFEPDQEAARAAE